MAQYRIKSFEDGHDRTGYLGGGLAGESGGKVFTNGGIFYLLLGLQIGLFLIQGWQRRFAMSGAIPLRSDFDAFALRRLAKQYCDPRQIRRPLCLAAVYVGVSRADAAKISKSAVF